MIDNIEIGKTYNCFDDGKINETRRFEVKITKIIPFEDVDEETLELWKEAVKECHWLYNKTTDYFIIGEDEDNESITFVRMKNQGWFGMGWLCGGQLDHDGSLYNSLLQYQKEWEEKNKNDSNTR